MAGTKQFLWDFSLKLKDLSYGTGHQPVWMLLESPGGSPGVKAGIVPPEHDHLRAQDGPETKGLALATDWLGSAALSIITWEETLGVSWEKLQAQT